MGLLSVAILSQVMDGNENSKIKLNLLKRSKTDADAANIAKLVQEIKKSGNGVGERIVHCDRDTDRVGGSLVKKFYVVKMLSKITC